MLKLTFLGTSAARPTVERNVSAIALVREGETLLFDCGEGTQRQMMRYGVSFALSEIFVTHFHADHFLGVVGLVRTLGLQGREEPLHLFGPRGGKRILGRALETGVERAPFPVDVHEVRPGQTLKRDEYGLEVIRADHGRDAVGYVLRERPRLGRFDPQTARSLGVPEGPLWGQLHRGQAVTLENGATVDPGRVVGPPRPGRVVVLTGDTRPSPVVQQAAAGADLLVHEATFAEEERERAHETGHSTARDAASIARQAGARRLALTHLSARYSASADVLLAEAQEVFSETIVARDGTTIEVPLQGDG